MADLPKGRYRVVVIDPPWPVKFRPRKDRPNQVAMPYRTMALDEIAALPVADLLADDAWIFCWTLSQFLPQTFAMLDGWGLRYRELMTWRKTTPLSRNVGVPSLGTMMRNSEFVVVGSVGCPKWTETKGLYAAFDGVRREHSRKPLEFDELLRRVTEGPRIELFARERKRGFDAWGDEAPSPSSDPA